MQRFAANVSIHLRTDGWGSRIKRAFIWYNDGRTYQWLEFQSGPILSCDQLRLSASADVIELLNNA